MKIMSRNFSRAEKIMLVLLGVMLVGLFYYRFVYLFVNNSTASSKAEAESLRAELEVAQARLDNINSMQSELNDLSAAGIKSRMESYNNSKLETAFLHTVLSDVEDYSISFANVTRDGNQIRRSFTLQFRTRNYKAAEKVVKEISDGQFRCLVGDMSCSINDRGETSIALTATFYETMVGGAPDAALPQDQAETNE